MASSSASNTLRQGVLHVRYSLFTNGEQKNVRTSMPYDTSTTGKDIIERLDEVIKLSSGCLEQNLPDMKLFFNHGKDFFAPVFDNTLVTQMRQFASVVDDGMPLVFVLTCDERIHGITTLVNNGSFNNGSFKIDRQAMSEQLQQQQHQQQRQPLKSTSSSSSSAKGVRREADDYGVEEQAEEGEQTHGAVIGKIGIFYVNGPQVAKLDVEYSEGDAAGIVLETCCEALSYHSQSQEALRPSVMALKYVKADGTPRYFLYDDPLPRSRAGAVPELELVFKPKSLSYMRPTSEVKEVKETLAEQQVVIAKLQGVLAEEKARHQRARGELQKAEAERAAVHQRYVDSCVAVKECEHLRQSIKLMKSEISRGLY